MKNVKFIVVLIMSFLLFILVSCGADIDDNENVSSSISNNASSSITNISSNISSSESTNVKYYDIQFQNFNGVENEILSTIKVKEGELPGYEGNTPTRQKDDNGSYVFDDWEPSLVPAKKNQIYTAKYKFEPKLNVIFDANGGEFDNNPHGFSVYKGDKIVSPISPTKTNYKLGGWTKTKDGTDYWDFSTDVVNANMTLYAKWETKEAIILSVEGSYIENNVIYMIVDKGIDSVSLSNMVITSNNSYWKLYYDKLGQTEIPTKIAASKDGELNNGDNEFYIVVTSADNLYTNTYKLIIHRSYLIRMDFYDYSVVIHSEYVYSGYEYEINYTPEIKGHTFEYWSYKEQKVEKIIPLGNVDIIAVATVNHYTIEFDSNGGNKVDNIEVEYGRLYNAPIPVREGYTFMGWEYNEELVVNPDGKSVERYLFDSNSKYVAKWQINQYTISLNINNSKAGSVSGAGTYDYGSSVTVKAQTNPGYTFNGWYINDEEYTTDSSFDYEVVASNVTFEARYTPNKYKITIDNQAEGVTISGITSGNSYDYNTAITLTATNVSSDKKLVWYFNDITVAYGNSYSFYVPLKDITIKLILADTLNDIAYKRDGNKIYFGTYPQTKLDATTDASTIAELNTKAGNLPTSSNTFSWIDYNYYIELSITSFMYYQDIDYDNNGTYDYRGVYFTQYRPIIYSISSSTDNTYQDDNGYSTNTIYWFSYDPIEWDILTESSGKALIIANLILDSQDYYPNSSSSTFSHNGGTGYANNYELSNIRKWLNDNFYNIAFNDLQKSLIETTTVDNSVSSTGESSNSYACNNTNDKMFLLSRKEATTYYISTSARTAKGSDYAKCQGLYVYSSNGNSYWWWRSPNENCAYYAYYVIDNGYFSMNYVYRTIYGVRPACWINL